MKRLFVLAVLLSGGLLHADGMNTQEIYKNRNAQTQNLFDALVRCHHLCEFPGSQEHMDKGAKAFVASTEDACHNACDEQANEMNAKIQSEAAKKIFELFKKENNIN